MSEEKVAKDEILQNVVNNLREVYDPEIPLNIYELGLIYKVDFNEENGVVDIVMTFTSPACPAAEMIYMDTEMACVSVDGVKSTNIEITWDPPWGPEQISEDGKLALGIPF